VVNLAGSTVVSTDSETLVGLLYTGQHVDDSTREARKARKKERK
jgi:hypothetical protein